MSQVTGAVGWRQPGIKYKRNEIFIDVIEQVNLLVSASGTILHSNVDGKIMIKSHLSGMPECRLGMNDKLRVQREEKGMPVGKVKSIELDDCTFHQCVKLSKFESERTISFVPPDGEFQLLKYRTTENIHPPFRISPNITEVAGTRIEAQVSVKSQYERDKVGTKVLIRIPVPENTATVKITTSGGKARYIPEEHAILWRIGRFPGLTEYKLAAHISLIATIKEHATWNRPPISMEYSVPMHRASGLNIRFLKVFEAKSRYETVKWIRYLCQNGNYQYRI